MLFHGEHSHGTLWVMGPRKASSSTASRIAGTKSVPHFPVSFRQIRPYSCKWVYSCQVLIFVLIGFNSVFNIAP